MDHGMCCSRDSTAVSSVDPAILLWMLILQCGFSVWILGVKCGLYDFIVDIVIVKLIIDIQFRSWYSSVTLGI